MKQGDTVRRMAELLDLPPETLPGTLRVTMVGTARVTVEHHRGILGYDDTLIEVGAGKGRVRIVGSGLCLVAMDRETLIVSGKIAAVEYA